MPRCCTSGVYSLSCVQKYCKSFIYIETARHERICHPWHPLCIDSEFSVVEEIHCDTMKNKRIDKLPLFEKVLAAGCFAILGDSLATESVFAMTILSITALAVVSVIQEVWW